MAPTELQSKSPLRRPQWRCDRVMRMISHRPAPLLPRRYDDHYVRAYRRFLLQAIAAGEQDEKRQAARLELQDVAQAHDIHFAQDLELRRMLEAYLLTSLSFEEIAERFGITAKAVEYYEALFFCVRDRLESGDWIHCSILKPLAAASHGKNKEMNDAQRDFVYKFFAYHGGPLVLQALLAGLSTRPPQTRNELGAWFDSSLKDIIRIAATAAAGSMAVNQDNAIRLIRLAVRQTSTSARAHGANGPSRHDERLIADIERHSEELSKRIEELRLTAGSTASSSPL